MPSAAKYACLLLAFCCLLQPLSAQFPQLGWVAQTVADSGFVNSDFIRTDPSGNVFVAGLLVNRADFDPGPGVTQLSSGGNVTAPFIQKLDSNGHFLWAHAFPPDSAWAVVLDLEVLDNGNSILSIRFTDSLDIDDGPGTNYVYSTGGYSMLLLEYDPAGQLRWHGVMTGQPVQVKDLVTDDLGNHYLTGEFDFECNFDLGNGGTTVYSNGIEVFLAKYDSNWVMQWQHHTYGGLNGAGGQGVRLALDPMQNVLVTGHYETISDFDPGPGVVTLPAGFSYPSFLAKYDPQGNLVWVKGSGGGTGSAFPMDMNCDAAGNVYEAGFFRDSLDADYGPGSSMIYASSLFGSYVRKLDGNGNLIWVRSWGRLQGTDAFSHALEPSGVSYFGMVFSDSIDVDPGPGITILPASNFSNRFFIAELDSMGLLSRYGEWGANVTDFRGLRNLTFDPNGAVLGTGFFSLPMDFDAGPGTTTLTPNSADGFVMRMAICSRAFTSVNVTGCDQVQYGGTLYDSSGTYYVHHSATTVCDSIEQIIVTLHGFPDTTVTYDLAQGLVAVAGADAYQWLDCDSGWVAVPNATDSTFLPTGQPLGNFAVAITQNGCTDTSGCHLLVITGREDQRETNVMVFPNPTDGAAQVRWREPQAWAELRLFDAHGRLVHAATLHDVSQAELELEGVPAGIYLLEVIGGEAGERTMFTLIRQ